MKREPKATLIYNPLAGPANLGATIELVADMWRAQGWVIMIRATQTRGHAIQLAREAAVAGHRLVLAAGGDGTLGEVANGLAGTETALAPLPVGTGNSFAKELRMPRPNLFNQHRLLQAADALLQGRLQWIDLGYTYDGHHSGRYWLLWTGAGADGFTVARLEPRPKWFKRLGAPGYAMHVLAVLPFFPRMWAQVEVDGCCFEGYFVLITVSNCRRYAGGELTLDPQAKLDDGFFEVWLFRGNNLAHIAYYVAQVKLGQHLRNPNVTRLSGRRVTIHTRPTLPCQTDGEKGGDTPLICELRPRALRLLAPNTAPADLFCWPGEALLSN